MKKTMTLLLVLMLSLVLFACSGNDNEKSSTTTPAATTTTSSSNSSTVLTDVDVDGLQLTLRNDNMYCVKDYTGTASTLTIPAFYNDIPIVEISQSAFSHATFTSISIPSSITKIGASAFEYCTQLSAVHISDLAAWCQIDFSGIFANPLSYAQKLYLNNSYVADLVIPDTITSIRSFAFYGCAELTSVTIPASVTSIGNSAFDKCTGLTAVHISDLATWCKIDFKNASANPLSLAHRLFLNNSYVTELVIPDTITSIRNYAFYGCTELTSVTIPTSIFSIENSAFYECTNISAATIPTSAISSIPKNSLTTIVLNSGTAIPKNAFKQYTALQSITLPNTITSIGESAFEYCTGLTSITIPSSVTRIEYSAFFSCSNLSAVHISDLDAWCRIQFSNSSSNPVYYAHNLYMENNLITNLVIPEGISSIGANSFTKCTSIVSITIPASVTSISKNAFDYCANIQYATIPTTAISYIPMDKLSVVEINGGTSIPEDAFRLCKTLQSITLPDTINSIGGSAFLGCTGLTSIAIPSSITYIENSAFYNCSNLTSVHISDLSAWCLLQFYNSTSNPLYYAHNLYLDNNLITNLQIPTNLSTIGTNVFTNCTSITNITIPSSVTTIAKNAFEGCNNIKSVSFENTSGWFRTSSVHSTTGTAIDVSISSTNASNLTTTYKSYYWKRNP